MSLWIVLFSFLFPTTPAEAVERPSVEVAAQAQPPLRYRGIEQLLAKFDAEAASESR